MSQSLTVTPDVFPLEKIKNKDIKQFCKEQQQQLTVCTPEHIRQCSCQDHKVAQLEKAIFHSKIQEYGEHVSDMIKEAKQHAAKEQAIKKWGEHCMHNAITCPYEQQVIVNVVTRLCGASNNLYDINHPNVAIIVASVVSQAVSLHRIALYSSKHGLVQVRVSEDGGVSRHLSPVEDLKLKYNKLIIESVEKLNNIVYGQKSLNLNVSASSDDIDLKSFMKQLRQ